MPHDTHDRHRRTLLLALATLPLSALLKPGRVWALANVVAIRTDGHYRYVEGNGVPDHATGRFPNRGNPFAIEEQQARFRMPLAPRRADEFFALTRGTFGVAVNGVPFKPNTDEYWQRDRDSGWRYEALGGVARLGLDFNHAHCQPGGLYHYHGIPTALVELLDHDRHGPLVGWAADGFPIYAGPGYGDPDDAHSEVRPLRPGYRLRSGSRPGGDAGPGGRYDGRFTADWEYLEGLGDLDLANGRVTVTPEYPDGTYAYFLSDTFPFTPRAFAGIPDRSFLRGPRAGGMEGRRFGRGMGEPGG